MRLKITIKRLEILFVIVYFVVAVVCYFLRGGSCLLASFASFSVGVGDWYVIKFMSIRWLKKGKFSFMENFFRYLLVGVSVWFLFKLKLDVVGIVLGLSVVPLSLATLSLVAMLSKNVTVDE